MTSKLLYRQLIEQFVMGSLRRTLSHSTGARHLYGTIGGARKAAADSSSSNDGMCAMGQTASRVPRNGIIVEKN